MGYESKLYIVEKTECFDETPIGRRQYGRVIAMFDLRKFSHLSDVLRECPATDCYIYADDGDTRILEDKYGKPLTETSIDVVKTLLDSAVAYEHDNECGWLTVVALRQYLDVLFMKPRTVVLHYGY